ncbi:hypothetical protein AA0114_g10584 [Alternaria tenuissima]|uniref:Uncharacterized protein n=1 Tax=Alternaria tenuissima TaxID=119927 RepID=A0A4Q4M3Z2_9PLEO|nr:hypothetical protein AA0114_g10584 [Alternaria tenuissima]RYO45535.1 hypothetical protein AA0116_g13213 [Alternaria tenuissima]
MLSFMSLSCVASSVAHFPNDGGRIARNLFTFGEKCKAHAVSYYGVSDCQTATAVSLSRCQQSISGCAPTACHAGSGTTWSSELRARTK